MDTIILLMLHGYVLPVLEQVRRWLPKIDQSLVRYFATNLLVATDPPYSSLFVDQVLLIIEEAFRKEHLDGFSGGQSRILLLQFFTSALSARPVDVLAERLQKAKTNLGL